MYSVSVMEVSSLQELITTSAIKSSLEGGGYKPDRVFMECRVRSIIIRLTCSGEDFHPRDLKALYEPSLVPGMP